MMLRPPRRSMTARRAHVRWRPFVVEHRDADDDPV